MTRPVGASGFAPRAILSDRISGPRPGLRFAGVLAVGATLEEARAALR